MHNAYGHLGAAALQELLHTRAWWPRMDNDIKQWIKTCPQCQISTGGPAATEPLHPLAPVPAFHRWNLDFIGPLPETSNGNRWLLVAIDHTTKWPIVKASPTATHELVAKFVYEAIVLNFGCPTEIITDRGTNFTTATLHSYFKLIGVKHLLTSAYHPRSNGAVERFNRLFGGMLMRYVGHDAVNKWDLYIDRALFACRIRQHHATGKTPFYMVYGIEPKLPGDQLLPIINNNDSNDSLRRIEQVNEVNQERDSVYHRLKLNATTMKQYYDKHLKPTTQAMEKGDWVLLRNVNRKKFQPRWTGPYKINEIFPLGTYRLEDVQGKSKDDLVHRDMLKLAFTRSIPIQLWYKPSRRSHNN